MMFTRYLPTGAAAVALALSGPAVFAAAKIETASFADAATDVGSALLQLSLFDPALGTLDAATLTFSGSLSTTAQVANNSAALNLTNVTVSLFGDLRATLNPGGPAAAPASVDFLAPGTFLGGRTFVVLGPGARTSVGPITQTFDPTAHSFSITSAADLQSLVGLGSFGYSFSGHTSGRVPTQFTTVSVGPSSHSSGTVTIEYDYTPLSSVPEPSAWMLLLAGMGTGGFLMRRRVQAVPARDPRA